MLMHRSVFASTRIDRIVGEEEIDHDRAVWALSYGATREPLMYPPQSTSSEMGVPAQTAILKSSATLRRVHSTLYGTYGI